MRNNQPVTKIEHKMKADDILVSRTDLKGHIIYANRAFCELAGFSDDELRGKAHNLVRHPDMPAAAFQDLWDTIRIEKPWTGMVKNRCKNGDYYWVVASVSPEYNTAGQVTGYISVRTAPTRAQIDATDALYRAVNAGKATLPSTIKAGFVKSLQLKTVMIAAAVVSLLTLVVLGGLFVESLTQQKRDTGMRVAAVPLITSLRHVLEFVPQHRGMGNAYLNNSNGNEALAVKLTQNEGKVDSLINTMVDGVVASPFPSLVKQTKTLQRQWASLKMQWKHGSAKESFRLHTALINGLLELDTTLLHKGKLTTDNALEIAHLAEFMAETVPGLNEYLGRLRGLGSGILAKGEMTSAEHDLLLELYVKAKLERDALTADIARVVKMYNPALRAPLSAPMKRLTAGTNTYLKLVKHDVLDADTMSLNSLQYFTAGTQAITASLTLFDAMDVSLTGLLQKENTAITQMYYVAIALVAFGVLGSLLLSMLMMQKTFKPLREIVEGMQRIVEGDYRTMPEKRAFDELGDIVDDMKTMQSILQYEIFEGKAMALARAEAERQSGLDRERVQTELADAFESNVGALVDSLANEATQVSSAAKEMDDLADALGEQSASALHGVDLGSSHVNSTAAAIEEMSVTIADVSRQVSETQSVSGQAVVEAETVTQMMQKLTRLADEVGSIVGAISDIAEQTNLLALNASIEAARAGDAGRGFSVVAGEVKELANQTSRATGQIREQVEGIQVESQQVMQAVQKISGTIADINNFTSTVAEAMEQQAQAGREISDAAQQADMSMGDARSSMDTLSVSAQQVDQSSDEMIEVADSMMVRTTNVQEGIQTFLATLRKV